MSVVSFQHKPQEGLNMWPLRVAGCSSPSRQGFVGEDAAGQPSQHSHQCLEQTTLKHQRSTRPTGICSRTRTGALGERGTQSKVCSSTERLEFL